jgi:hypothetical protein
MPDSHSPHPEQRHVRDVPVERPLRRQPRHRGRCMRIRCSIQASSFAKDVKKCSNNRTTQLRRGCARRDSYASTRFFKNWPLDPISRLFNLSAFNFMSPLCPQFIYVRMYVVFPIMPFNNSNYTFICKKSCDQCVPLKSHSPRTKCLHSSHFRDLLGLALT